ncbi:MAG: DUF177 domain-containing protein [Fidelibacterota bacterium]
MKLLRSELNRGLHEELFEIPVAILEDDECTFLKPVLQCTVSSQTVPTGFKLFGMIDMPIELVCDRCLETFSSHFHPRFEIWLTPDRQIADESSLDMLWFPDSTDEIDLTTVFHDVILMEIPFKKLCTGSCQGLCDQCGINLNRDTCTCEKHSRDPRWDKLEKLIN